jgi:hypothetical protein
MKQNSVDADIEILFATKEGEEVDRTVAAYDRIVSNATVDDLPKLIASIYRKDANSWVRGMLSEPIANLGGLAMLPILFDADALNEGDIPFDGVDHALLLLCMKDRFACKGELLEILEDPQSPHHERAKRLLEFTEHPPSAFGLPQTGDPKSN